MSIRSIWTALCAGALACVAVGCSTLPDSGAVHTLPDRAGETGGQASYFVPPGPAKDAPPSDIVRGFLRAMQANPPSTRVARSFLSDRAKETWKPKEGTIVYDAASVDSSGDQVTARLRGAYRLSPNGAWLDGTHPTTTTVPLALVQVQGQWRIDNPPNVLAVPATYFPSLFTSFDLYFFDRTGTVLVPTKVYVPRGEETATNLVRGLLAGPPADLRDVAVSAFPAGLELDQLAVVVNEDGIADVPLEPEVLDLSPAELNRAVVQLGWTLRQVAGISRLKLTVGGAPVPLADGRTDVSVAVGAEYDALGAPQPDFLAISDGRVVRDDGGDLEPVGGPLGEDGFALKTLAWSARTHRVAAVSGNGRRVFTAADRGRRSADRVHTVVDRGTDVLRPAYDRFGNLWVVDATREGAVVHVVTGRRDRVVHVEGISGRSVSAFTVTNDGTSLVAVLGTGANPIIEVSSIVRGVDGGVQAVSTARTLLIGGADLGPARDVVQNGATTVAVLTTPASGPDQITYVELDGSPVSDSSLALRPPEAVPGAISALLASPDPGLPLRVVGGDRRLYTYAYSDTGRWTRATLSDVVAAAYAE
jgi:hypothetical protein